MATRYETDTAAWAKEQADLLRAGNFAALDLEHLADEIEDVGKSEKRELASRLAVLHAHLLKWHFQPERRGPSWQRTIILQRREVLAVLDETPSLKTCLADDAWLGRVWDMALRQATEETGIATLPEHCPWLLVDMLGQDWLPG